MIGTNRLNTQRLYLDKKEKEEIYIDTWPLPQHQIDGIRFLFKQFKKKKPGVILNNPEGYGKTVQVALFLNAVSKLLKHPVLILCKDDNEIDSWIQTLKIWTKFTLDDIAFETVNVYERKRIFLKKATDLALYGRRDWAVVVVKNDFAPRELMRMSFSAGFRVWLTTIDMRKDLQMLNAIYGWMYSEKRFHVQSLLDSETQCRGPLDRLKLLDAFLEDVVIMRNDFTTPYKAIQIDMLHTISKVTRKNKDATGTKIKRSKKRTEDAEQPPNKHKDDNSTVNFSSTSDAIPAAKSSANESRTVDQIAEGTFRNEAIREMDIESFIRNKEPVTRMVYELTKAENTDVNIRFADAARDIVNIENETPKDNAETDSESVLTNFNATDEFRAAGEGKEPEEKIDKVTASDIEEPEIDKEIASDINLNIISKGGEKNGDKETTLAPLSNPNVTEADIIAVGIPDISGLETVKDELAVEKPVIEEKTINKRDIDYKINEMEEQALKKFKGTLLDTLF
ncbi:unnamed protein product, partial [Iphiclides podalirius]